MKRLAIIGSTGSVGRQTLDVVRAFPGQLSVRALVAGFNTTLLAEQIEEFGPQVYACQSPGPPAEWHHAQRSETRAIVEDNANDIIVVAVDGIAGFEITVSALKAGHRVALANKETLLIGGQSLIALAESTGATILPVDSEPSALWQCMEGSTVRPTELIVTASGGAFYESQWSELDKITPAQATSHPIWNMGRKISVDSSNLVNKAFEVIETHLLFDFPYPAIKVVIHRQSIVHAAVKFGDGAVKALLSPPDMRHPIQYALLHPERPAGSLPADNWDITGSSELTFEPLVKGRHPCFDTALEYGSRGGTWSAALAGADQAAVELFLESKIGYTAILNVLEETLAKHEGSARCDLEQARAACQSAYRYARKNWGK